MARLACAAVKQREVLSQSNKEREDIRTYTVTHTCLYTLMHTIPAHAHAHTHAQTYMQTHTEWATFSAKSHSGLFGHTVSVSVNWLYHCGHKAIKIINK